MAHQIEALEPKQAAKAYLGLPDPIGQATPESLAAEGHSFELKTPGGSLIFTVKPLGKCLWIEAGAGCGADDMAAYGAVLIEAMAKAAGLASVGFQTARPGLVRKAKKQGYTVAGWILKKAV